MRLDSDLRYVFADHLGSASVTASLDGQYVFRQLYKAWGETRWTEYVEPPPDPIDPCILDPSGYNCANTVIESTSAIQSSAAEAGTTSTTQSTVVTTKYAYTGQFAYDAADELGLLYYRSRFYDNSLGRFASADSVIPEASQGVQAWDRFAGMNNNPVRWDDPSGHCTDGITTIFCIAMGVGGVIGAAVSAYNQYQETGTIDLGQVAYDTVGGALIAGGAVIAVAAGAPLLPVAACADGDCGNEARTLSTTLYRFGGGLNGLNPGPNPKPSDFPSLNGIESGMVGPEFPPTPNGLSTFADPLKSGLSGQTYSLPGGYSLPNGLGVIADGKDVLTYSTQSETHHTIFPTVAMEFEKWIGLINSLPWKAADKIAKPK